MGEAVCLHLHSLANLGPHLGSPTGSTVRNHCVNGCSAPGELPSLWASGKWDGGEERKQSGSAGDHRLPARIAEPLYASGT